MSTVVECFSLKDQLVFALNCSNINQLFSFQLALLISYFNLAIVEIGVFFFCKLLKRQKAKVKKKNHLNVNLPNYQSIRKRFASNSEQALGFLHILSGCLQSDSIRVAFCDVRSDCLSLSLSLSELKSTLKRNVRFQLLRLSWLRLLSIAILVLLILNWK